jgi:hypothetical protein
MFDPYHKWLGIAKEEQPPTYYRLLGISVHEQDAEVIEEAAIRQTTHVRTNQLGPHAEECTRLLNEIAKARSTLLDPVKRRQYDATLPAKKEPPRPATKPGKPWLYGAAALGAVTLAALVWLTASLLGSRTDAKDPPIAEGPRKGPAEPPKLLVKEAPQPGPGSVKIEAKEASPKQPVGVGPALIPEESRRKGYLTGKGTWRIEGEHLVSDSKMSVLVFGDAAWTDYDFSFVAERLTGDAGFAAIFRSRHGADQKDSYTAVLPARFTNGLFHALQQRDDGTFYQPGDKKGKVLPSTYAGKDFRIEVGQPYRVMISVRKADCECFLNDKRVLKYVKLEYEQGAVGLRNPAGGHSTRVRDILVRSPEGKVLWQGPPVLD